MKRIILIFVLLGSLISMASGSIEFEFFAPIIADKDQITNSVPFGSIRYDVQDGNFVGLDSEGNWVELSKPSTDFLSNSTTTAKQVGTTGDYVDMDDTGKLSLTTGEWVLNGTVEWLDGGSPAYTGVRAGWYAADGSDNSTEPAKISATSGIEVQAGLEALSVIVTSSPGRDEFTLNSAPLRVKVTAASVDVFLVPRTHFTGSSGDTSLKVYVYAEKVK